MRYLALVAAILVLWWLIQPHMAHSELAPNSSQQNSEEIQPAPKSIHAYVTGYESVPSQTDSSPCLAAGGNICGRTDAVACPRAIPLHTWVEIGRKEYECMDRTALKYDDRFDISCDKDKKCPYEVTGWYDINIIGGKNELTGV